MTACPLTADDCTLLNLRGVAGRLGVSYDYVKDMKKMGFELPYGGMTTLTHALNWINANPEFRSEALLLKRSSGPMRLGHRQRSTAGKSYEPRLKHD